LPKVDKLDFYKMCRVINFPTRFVDNPKEINEKKADKELEVKMRNWYADFMLLLLEYYGKFMKDGLKEINEVMIGFEISREPTQSFS
jgi:hypothetical protein